MRKRPEAYVADMRRACALIVRMTDGKSVEDFEHDEILRLAVERAFGILGEALVKLGKLDAALAARIPNAHMIVGFRNVIVRGYDELDSRIVFQTARQDVPQLQVFLQTFDR